MEGGWILCGDPDLYTTCPWVNLHNTVKCAAAVIPLGKRSRHLYAEYQTLRSIRTSKTCSSLSDRLENTSPWLNSWLGRRRKAENPFSESCTKVPWIAWNCWGSWTEDVVLLDGSSAIIDNSKRPQTAWFQTTRHNTTQTVRKPQLGHSPDRWRWTELKNNKHYFLPSNRFNIFYLRKKKVVATAINKRGPLETFFLQEKKFLFSPYCLN